MKKTYLWLEINGNKQNIMMLQDKTCNEYLRQTLVSVCKGTLIRIYEYMIKITKRKSYETETWHTKEQLWQKRYFAKL